MMAQSKHVSILMLIAVAAAIPYSTEAADYVVGGSTGWTNSPPGGASFYSNWASNITFRENDVLVFNFVTGSHTVSELTKANYDTCSVGQSIQTLVTSPARFTLNRTGEFYFSCTFQGHCGNGQKLSVNVAAVSSPPPRNSPAPSEGPSSSTTPESAQSPAEVPSPAEGPNSSTTPESPQSPAEVPSSPPESGTTPSPTANEGAPPPSSATDQPGATPPSTGSATILFSSFSLLLATFVINILF